MLIIKEESGLVLEDIDKDKNKDKKNLIGLILDKKDKKDIFNLINMYICYYIYYIYCI